MIILFLIIALVVVYYVFNQLFYIACGVIGVLLGIVIYLIIRRKRR